MSVNARNNTKADGFLLLLILFSGCTRSFSTADVRGRYLAESAQAREVLTVRSNGTYEQIVSLKLSTNSYRVEGKWRLIQNVRGITYVYFDKHFLLVLDGFGNTNKEFPQARADDVEIPLEVGTSLLGKVQLGVSPGIKYRRAELKFGVIGLKN